MIHDIRTYWLLLALLADRGAGLVLGLGIWQQTPDII